MTGLSALIPVVGVVAACMALHVSRASYYRAEASAGPQAKTSPGACAVRRGARTRTRNAGQRALHGPGTGAGLREAARGRRAPVLDEDHVPRARRRRSGPRAPRAASPPRVHQAAARRDRAEPGVVVGHNEVAWSDERHVLHAVRHPRHLQPVHRRLAGRRARVGRGRRPLWLPTTSTSQTTVRLGS